jgi:hypothetical protein
MRRDDLSKDGDISARIYAPICPLLPQQQTFEDRAEMSVMCHKRKSPLCSITSSPRASTWLRWSFGQPGSPQSFFFVSQKVFALPRAPHVLESGNT